MDENKFNRLQFDTKDKFEALLKQALNSKKAKNAHNRILVDNLNTESEEERFSGNQGLHIENKESVTIVHADVHEQMEKNNFILNKFLNDDSEFKIPVMDESLAIKNSQSLNSGITKPPIPLPRSKIKSKAPSETSSKRTFVVESPNMIGTEAKDCEFSDTSSLKVINDISKCDVKTKNHEHIDLKSPEKSNKNCKVGTSIIIHKADHFNRDWLHTQLWVKIHIVNKKNGEYIQHATNSNMEPSYIEPMQTVTNGLQEHFRSLTPRWEETLTIHEDMNNILQKQNKPIIFFEILNTTNNSCSKVAWAFLKLLNKNGDSNVEKQMRLQLYYPDVDYKNVPKNVCNIYHWWKGKKLMKYPSTLFVSIKRVQISQTLNNPEEDTLCDKTSELIVNNENQMPWTRPQYQTCKLPNKCVHKLHTYDEGCLTMQFSNNGLFLAYAVLISDLYFVVIISMKTFDEIYKYSAHQGVIYNIAWSKDDKIVVTASADCTVCIWDFYRRTYIEVLPHPSYVYAAVVSSSNIVATGSYDQMVRIWGIPQSDNGDATLIQELEHHNGYVTCLCFNKKATLLYSADSLGIIIEWIYTTAWDIRREIKLVDLRDTIVNQIILHNRERRMVIHSRDSILRIVDLNTGSVLNWLYGGINNKYQSMCSLSSCGTFIVAGSENGTINVWNSDSGKHVASYSLDNRSEPILCTAFHPHDNIMAVSRYCSNSPIALLAFDQNHHDNSEVGLLLLETSTKIQFGANKFKDTAKAVAQKSAKNGSKPLLKLEEVLEKLDQIILNQCPDKLPLSTVK